jgi:hypothetical protein
MRPKICYPSWGADEVDSEATAEISEPIRSNYRRQRSAKTSRRRSSRTDAARPVLGISGRRRKRFSW